MGTTFTNGDAFVVIFHVLPTNIWAAKYLRINGGDNIYIFPRSIQSGIPYMLIFDVNKGCWKVSNFIDTAHEEHGHDSDYIDDSQTMKFVHRYEAFWQRNLNTILEPGVYTGHFVNIPADPDIGMIPNGSQIHATRGNPNYDNQGRRCCFGTLRVECIPIYAHPNGNYSGIAMDNSYSWIIIQEFTPILTNSGRGTVHEQGLTTYKRQISAKNGMPYYDSSDYGWNEIANHENCDNWCDVWGSWHRIYSYPIGT